MTHSLWTQALAQIQARDYTGAIATLTQLIESHPHDAPAYFQRGKAHFQAGQIYEAVSDYGKTLALDPQHAQAYYGRALARLTLKNPLGALADINAALDQQPDYAAAHQLRATLHERQAQTRQAIADYKAAAKLFLAQDKPDGARYCLDKIDQIQAQTIRPPSSHPHSPTPGEKDYFQHILSLTQQGDTRQALEDINWILQADSQDGRAHCCRGLVYLKQGNLQGAMADLNQALALQFTDALVYRSRAKARLQLGDIQGAIADCNQALSLSPEDAETYVARGNAYRSMQHYLGAIEDYGEALSRHPENPEVFFDRGNTYALIGDRPQAIADYQRAMTLFCAQENWPQYHRVQNQLAALESQAPAAAASSPGDRLYQRLLGLIGGNRDLAEGMIKRMKHQYPGRSQEWYLESVIHNLEQNLDF
ncbi:tetratricopeptide repeat protein [Lyngbya confervoides]|uniref:Tetratricopeptide repeat protein n=1 Tax=Lyngbya confervoides BDU141951 TaxID=1574623 RepID=A0ABD4SZM4_9CYAN|nr:tetratricopeptide repeat protein [Lyngbya confervoides]MCM1981906.1 tetratricopeptide repeat protein [Lyngbya confervoides BDU141951]